MPSIPHPDRAAAQVLDHPLAQRFSYRAVELLRAIERGDDGVAAADADRLLQIALQAVVTSR